MSSSANRRYRRKMERDIKKDMKKQGRELEIPTEKDIQDYINKRITELKLEPNGMQLQETI
jgi:hypothetical protein